MKNSIQKLLPELRHLLKSEANPEQAIQMSAYMKNRFSFFGIKSPERRKLTGEWQKTFTISSESELLNLSNELWKLEQREFQYVACDSLKKHKNLLTLNSLSTLKNLICTKSWWDTVDVIASHPVGQIVLNFPECGETMDSWINDENMWVRRTAILHQLQFKTETNEKRLFRYCEKCMEEKEFFICKAIGWALRQYSYINMEAVLDFVRKNEERLSLLSTREALKGFRRLNK